jgi:DNA-binding transcriptional LysR family regulator
MLEEECNVKLHKKIGRGIELTDEGELFLADAQPILLQVEKIKERFTSNQLESKPGSLAIGGSHSQSVSFLPLLLAVFKETHPQVQLSLRTDSSRGIERLVLNSEVEIGLITNLSHTPTLSYEPCRKEKFLFFVSPSHPLAQKKEMTVAEMAQAPLIFRKGKSSRTMVWEVLKQVEKQGFKLNIVMHCESTEAVKTAVSTGMGLGILYQDHVQSEIRKGELKEIRVPELNMQLDSYVIYVKEKPLSSNAKDFLTLLRKWQQKIQVTKGLPPAVLASRSVRYVGARGSRH